jgi:hypothetical protein
VGDCWRCWVEDEDAHTDIHGQCRWSTKCRHRGAPRACVDEERAAATVPSPRAGADEERAAVAVLSPKASADVELEALMVPDMADSAVESKDIARTSQSGETRHRKAARKRSPCRRGSRGGRRVGTTT